MKTSPGNKNVDPLQAWALIIGATSIAVGGVVLSAGSRLVGGLLIGIPLLLFVVALVRTPKHAWQQIAEAEKQAEKDREANPRTGKLWAIFHRVMDVVGFGLAVLMIVVIATSIFS